MHAIEVLHSITAIRPSDTGGANYQRPNAGLGFLAQLELGQHLRATVQAGLSNTEFAVVLSSGDGMASVGQTVHMKLPAGMQVGDRLNLVLVGRQPRPQFLLVADLSPQPDLLRLSGTARFIDDLLRYPSFTDRLAVSPAIPLLGGPPDAPAELSLRLTEVLGRSGLFYESHQAQWIAGKRTFSELLLEPQARLAGLGSHARAADISDRGATAADASLVRDSVPAEDRVRLDSTQRALAHPDPFPRDALALVRQQLDVLETRHITWQGEAWPSQAITLETFEEEPSKSGSSAEPDQPSVLPWKTCLRLTLPALGKITANLRLHAHGLDVNLIAPDSEISATLRSGTALLARNLESGGIKLLSMGLDVDEETGSA